MNLPKPNSARHINRQVTHAEKPTFTPSVQHSPRRKSTSSSSTTTRSTSSGRKKKSSYRVNEPSLLPVKPFILAGITLALSYGVYLFMT